MQLLPTIITVAITALITGLITFLIQEKRLRTELRTEFMAEQAVRKLLQNKNWRKRSFESIKKRIGGFEDNELRKILVRSGAVEFEGENGKELWGLIDCNEDAL
jgi:hypothetical protein